VHTVYGFDYTDFLFKPPLDGEINVLMTSGKPPVFFSDSVFDFTRLSLALSYQVA